MSKTLEQAAQDFSDKYWSNLTDYEKISCFKAGAEFMQKEYEEKLRWMSIAEPPKKAELIILEYSGCSNSKKYVIYDFYPEYFEGVFHVNGVAERWRSFL